MYTYFQHPVHWQPDQYWVTTQKPMSRVYAMTSTADQHPVSNDSLILTVGGMVILIYVHVYAYVLFLQAH